LSIVAWVTGGGGGGARAGTIALQLVLDDGRARAVVIALLLLEAIIYLLVDFVAYCLLLSLNYLPI
jgi:hypothetical protein